MAKIIAMMNQKGGVGKTTTSVNLSACLAVADKKILLLDLDPQGNGSVSVGVGPQQCKDANIYHALIGEMDIKKTIYPTKLKNFDICPADNNLSGALVELVSEFAREQKLKTALEPIMNLYDYVIIDCPPSLNLLTINALTAAHKYIVPMQTEYLSLEGLAQLQSTTQKIKQSLNPKLELEGIVLTMYDNRASLHKQVAEEVISAFKELVYKTVIPRSVKLGECPSFGKPIILYDIKCKGSEAYLSLAKEFLIREEGNEDEKPPVVSQQMLFQNNNNIENEVTFI